MYRVPIVYEYIPLLLVLERFTRLLRALAYVPLLFTVHTRHIKSHNECGPPRAPLAERRSGSAQHGSVAHATTRTRAGLGSNSR